MINNRLIPRIYYLFTILYFLLRDINNKLSFFTNIIPLLKGDTCIRVKLQNKWNFKIRDLYDILTLKEVFRDQIYKPLFQNLNAYTTLIDIGSYIGDTAIYAQQFVNINHVIAIEPMPDNMRFVKKNVQLNAVRNIQLIQAAVSTKKGVTDLFIHPNKGQSGFFQYAQATRRIKVKTITLSQIIDLIKTSSIVIKCDCEGAEYEIFLNLPLKYLSKIEKIIFEYHNIGKLQEILARLNEAGFYTSYIKHPVEPNLGTAFAYRYGN